MRGTELTGRRAWARLVWVGALHLWWLGAPPSYRATSLTHYRLGLADVSMRVRARGAAICCQPGSEGLPPQLCLLGLGWILSFEFLACFPGGLQLLFQVTANFQGLPAKLLTVSAKASGSQRKFLGVGLRRQ